MAAVDRSQTAVGWIVVAALAVVVAGIAYLHPSLTAPAQPAPATASRPGMNGALQLTGAAFADADHGLMSVLEQPPRQVAYETSDGGARWTRVQQGAIVTGLDPTSGRPELVRTQNGPSVTGFSLDGGRTWRPVPVEPGVQGGPPVFLDDVRGWWIAERGGAPALWRTNDGGRTWEELPQPVLPAGSSLIFRLLFVDQHRGVMPVIAADGTPTILATPDGGESWHPAITLPSPMLGTRPINVALRQLGGRLLAWMQTLPAEQVGAGGGFRIGPDPHFDAYPFLSASDDGGQTWSLLVAGPHLESRSLPSPEVDDRGRLLLLEGRRLWVSLDAGATWTAHVIQAPADREPDVLLAPAAGGALFAFASGTASRGDGRVLLRSTDGGARWEEIRLPRLAP